MTGSFQRFKGLQQAAFKLFVLTPAHFSALFWFSHSSLKQHGPYSFFKIFLSFHIFLPFFRCLSFILISFLRNCSLNFFPSFFALSFLFLLLSANPCIRCFFIFPSWSMGFTTKHIFNQLFTALNFTDKTLVFPSRSLISTCF